MKRLSPSSDTHEEDNSQKPSTRIIRELEELYFEITGIAMAAAFIIGLVVGFTMLVMTPI